MKLLKKLLICLIVFALLPVCAFADGDGEAPEMGDGIAVRTVVNGVTSNIAYAGDIINVQFWINGINPQSVNIPLSWDPNVVTVVNQSTGETIADGRKTESESTAGGAGFTVGAKCYDMTTDDDYMPLYWNGRPVYTTGNEANPGGYPYLNGQNGLYSFFYFVLSPTRGQVPQMFLEVSFKAIAEGDPNFHIATSADGSGRFDIASPNGITVVFPSSSDSDSDSENQDNIVILTDSVEFPEFAVVKEEDVQELPTIPPVTLNTPTPSPTAKPSTGGTTGGTSSGTSSGGSSGSSGGSSGSTKATPTPSPTPVPLTKAEHLDAHWVYADPVKISAELDKRSAISGSTQNVAPTGCILPPGVLSEAINTASGEKAVVIAMPDEIPPGDTYRLTLYCSNLDDMYLAGLYMLYAETPYAYVGINPSALLKYTRDSSVLTLDVSAAADGINVVTLVDGVRTDRFSSPVYRFIVPTDMKNPCAYAHNAFGTDSDETETETVTESATESEYPLSVCRYYADKNALVFLSTSGGHITVREGDTAEFSDLDDYAWAEDYISSLAERGIITGTGGGKFSPADTLTRNQTAVLITRAFGVYADSPTAAFTDADGFYYPYIASAHAAGIINGVSETEFSGGASVTREDLAVMLVRACDALGIKLPETVNKISFKDDGDIADYAKDAVYALARAGVINGRDNGAFDPLGTATRAEAAKIIGAVYPAIQELM